MSPKLRVLELYSGIGGMHWALKESGVEYKVIMAVDINTTANIIYKHNFPFTNIQSFGLEKLTLQKLESLNIDTILMSPPCQPFTRVGKKGDCEDTRTKSFLHILHLVREMKTKPKYLLVENVKGFEVSQTHKKLIECLEDCGYNYQEFLLTPLQFGIPNCRLRYYLIARWKDSFAFVTQSKILTDIPVLTHCGNGDASQNLVKPHDDAKNNIANSVNIINQHGHVCISAPKSISSSGLLDKESSITQSNLCYSDMSFSKETVSCELHDGKLFQSNSCETNQDNNCKIYKCDLCELKDAGRNMRYCEEEDDFVNESSRSLCDFMECTTFDELQEYWLSERELRLFVVMDVVFPALKKSTCFTKRYGHYVDGAGSVVQMSSNVEDVRAASRLKSYAVKMNNRSEWGDVEINIIRNLKLRYFTPKEVSRLLCFPAEFDFPSGVSTIQKYRVLGNSLNVHVVAELIKVMIQEVGT